MKGPNSLTAFIFARGGSKGIKKKNIHPVAGKPLLAYAIASALSSRTVGRVVVSTDDKEIAATAKKSGADILERPADLAGDASPEALSWRHAIESFPALFSGPESQPFISLPATSPLRAPEDVDAAVAKYREGSFDIIFGITPSDRNPYLNMVVIKEGGLIELVNRGASGVRRQDVPAVYSITTSVYVANPDYVLNCGKLIEGRAGHVVIPPERALDIDNHFDLYLAELMLSHPYK